MTAKVAAWLFTVCLSTAVARPALVEGYRARLPSGEQVDAYAVMPRQLLLPPNGFVDAVRSRWRSRANAALAARLLGNAAAFVDGYSRGAGHVNRRTAFYHRREIRRLARGDWPTVVVTRPDEPDEVLLTVSIAVPWDFEAIPAKVRFYARGIPGLPSTYGTLAAGIQSFAEEDGFIRPYTAFDGASGAFHVVSDLSVILSMLPWAVGHEAEIKFLTQRPRSPAGLSAIAHALIVAHGMHRMSGVPLPRLLRERQQAFLADPTLRAHLRHRISEARAERKARIPDDAHRSEEARFLDAFFDGLEAAIFSPRGFQRTLGIATLYAQVSAMGPEESGTTRLFLRQFRFPETPVLDFMETHRFGTAGVRTRIFALDMTNFDLDMMAGLNRRKESPAVGVHFTKLALPPACSLLLTDFDAQVAQNAFEADQRSP